MQIATIGGGAAGFFAAITAKENFPDSRVTIFEKSAKVLSKVKISGGGRCNVTNSVSTVPELIKAYPRGGNSLKKLFHEFSNKDSIQWFESRGVPLVTQDDGCVFPAAQDSQVIINCFLNETNRLGVELETSCGVAALVPVKQKWKLLFDREDRESRLFDKVIVTTGGCSRSDGFEWLKKLGHKIELPMPSLFTFNMPEAPVTRLMGIVAEDVKVSVEGSRFNASGDLLITHWGMSGPVILKLSSFAARYLNKLNYDFNISVNWLGETDHYEVAKHLDETARKHSKKMVANYRPFGLSERLWIFLIEKCGCPGNKKWGELGKKGLNKLVETLTHDRYPVSGKSTFRDEFVTCGGIALSGVDMKSMQSKLAPDLYFAGEVLDIDAITGGFNFQAAWTTGYIAGQLR
jgi:predicted Rossmann fold flavoprotein